MVSTRAFCKSTSSILCIDYLLRRSDDDDGTTLSLSLCRLVVIIILCPLFSPGGTCAMQLYTSIILSSSSSLF